MLLMINQLVEVQVKQTELDVQVAHKFGQAKQVLVEK